ncbi:MAG: hypothetical protein AAB503_01500 [Patescibacteria group bacterium]
MFAWFLILGVPVIMVIMIVIFIAGCLLSLKVKTVKIAEATNVIFMVCEWIGFIIAVGFTVALIGTIQGDLSPSISMLKMVIGSAANYISWGAGMWLTDLHQ